MGVYQGESQMKKETKNPYTSIIKMVNWKVNAYFLILLTMFVLNVFILRNISNQVYWHDKLTVEAMACVKDAECSLDPLVSRDYYPPEYN